MALKQKELGHLQNNFQSYFSAHEVACTIRRELRFHSKGVFKMAARDSRGYVIEVGDQVVRTSAGSSNTLEIGATYVVSGINFSNNWLFLDGVSGEYSPALFEKQTAHVQQVIDLSRFSVKVEDWANQSYYIAVTERPANGAAEGGSPVFSFFSISERPDPANAVQITNLAKQDRIRVLSALVDNWFKILDKLGLPADVEIDTFRKYLNSAKKEYESTAAPDVHVASGRRVDLAVEA